MVGTRFIDHYILYYKMTSHCNVSMDIYPWIDSTIKQNNEGLKMRLSEWRI